MALTVCGMQDRGRGRGGGEREKVSGQVYL